MAEDAKALIELATRRFVGEVPALEPIKLVVGVELRGRGDVQHFRLEMPDVKVTKGPAADARVRVDMRREFFNVMAREAKIADWVEAFTYGQAKASGPEQILRLVDQRRRAPAGARTHAARPAGTRSGSRARRLVVAGLRASSIMSVRRGGGCLLALAVLALAPQPAAAALVWARARALDGAPPSAPKPASFELDSVACASPASCVAVGSYIATVPSHEQAGASGSTLP